MKKSNTAEVVEQIELSQLHPFPDHPFGVRDDDNMQQTVSVPLHPCLFTDYAY